MRLSASLSTLLAGLVLAGTAFAQSFPSRPVTLMVPYPAGGLSDVVARKVNTALAKALGQPVIIENLGGAGGAIAAQKVLNAPADGHILFQGSPNELILAPLANAAVKYRTEDFREVRRVAISPLAITARKDLPANTADELAALAQKAAREGKPLNFASVGPGSFYHLLGEQMAQQLGAPMLHVPYKGGADILRDLLGGQIDLFLTPYGAPHVEMARQGKLKFVAALSAQRQPMLKDVPAVDEGKALKGFHYSIGTGYYVRKDTPEPIVQALHKALDDVMADPEVRSGLLVLGMEPAPAQGLDALARQYVADAGAYRAIAKSIQLQAQ